MQAFCEFEALARLATRVCNAPIALIAIADGQSPFVKCALGIEHDVAEQIARVSQRSGDAQTLEVPDTRLDPRFANHESVRAEPGLRYYRGIPLYANSGDRLGTVAVLDTVPRAMDAESLAALEDIAALAVELIEKRRAKREAQAREAMLDSLLEALPTGVVACNAEGELNLFNSVARDWHDSDPLVIPQEQWSEHFDLYEADGKTLLPTARVPLIRALATERIENEEICIKAHDRPPRLVSCSGRAFRSPDQELLGAVVTMHDVTDRKRDEQRIMSMRRYLQAVIDASTEVAIIAMDRDGTVSVFNPGAERLLGYSADEVVGKFDFQQFLSPNDVAAYAAEVNAEYGTRLNGFLALTARPRRDTIENREWCFKRSDGGFVSLRLVLTAIRDHKSKTIGFLGIAIDRSQLQAMERALETSEAQFRSAFDTAPQGMALVSLDGQFIEVNRSLCEMLDYTHEQLLALDFQMLTHPEDLAADLAQVHALINGEIPQYQLVKRYIDRNEEIVWGELSVSLVRDTEGEPLYFVSQIQNITEQRQLERLKSEFVAVVSHELRTPLTSIKGALSLMNAGAVGTLPEPMKNMVDLAERNASRLGLLLNDLLDWEKLAADRMPFDIRPHGLTSLLVDSIESNLGYAESFGVKLARINGEPVTIEADSLRFAQIMANLLSNAIKFSPAQATVTVDHACKAGEVFVRVSDNGPGIPLEFRNRVFQLFAQAESGNTRRQGGTGLGLAITKQLVEYMDGRIGFDSELGRGTTFWFCLPCTPAQVEDSQ